MGTQVAFPDWVPEAARRRIGELRETPQGITEAASGFLTRFATYQVMKTEVWRKLPSKPERFEGQVTDWAFNAFTIYLALRRPYPKTKLGWVQWVSHLEKHQTLPDLAHTSQLACALVEAIYKAKGATDFYWDRFWTGRKSLTSDQVLTILDELRAFYVRIHEEYQAVFAGLPEVKRWNAAGHQKFFTEYLSARMTKTYGKPLDSIVAALTEVAFDLDEGVAAETIRGRRRVADTSENSKRKSR